jgi:hypothetical protein
MKILPDLDETQIFGATGWVPRLTERTLTQGGQAGTLDTFGALVCMPLNSHCWPPSQGGQWNSFPNSPGFSSGILKKTSSIPTCKVETGMTGERGTTGTLFNGETHSAERIAVTATGAGQKDFTTKNICVLDVHEAFPFALFI